MVDFDIESDRVVVEPPQTGISFPFFAAFTASTNISFEGRSFSSLKVIHSARKKRLLEKDGGRAEDDVMMFNWCVEEKEGMLKDVLMRLMIFVVSSSSLLL